jgi:CIC family chloride channel protein
VELVKFIQRLPVQSQAIIRTCVYGLGAGVAAVAFQQGMNAVYKLAYISLAQQSHLTFVLGTLIVILCTSLAVGYLLTRFAPEAAGSGIPQLKASFWKDFGQVPWRVVWVKYLAGVLSVGGGSSLGREGPSVQLGGGVGSNLARLLGESKQNHRMACAAGAAAGLAAAFNTPLAAVTFVLEEIIADLNSVLLGSVLLASVIGAFVVHGLVGKQPAFTLSSLDSPGVWVYAMTPLVAAAAALIGAWFQKWTMRLRAGSKKFNQIPPMLRPVLGGLITWALGCSVFLASGHLGVFGLGYDDLSAALAGGIGWKIAAMLLAAKLAATIACFGLGGCGGIFSPTLFFGAMAGICLSALGSLALPLSHPDQMILAVVGMSACLGAVVRAPVTGILIVFEMTHEFALVPALMLGALVSQAISRKLNRHNFYEEILQQDGHQIERMVPPRNLQSWENMPVSAVANFNPLIATDISSDSLTKLFSAHPYQRIPVVLNGTLTGVITRQEAEAAVRENRPARCEPATTCTPGETIRQIEARMVDSGTLLLILTDRPGGQVLGIITLHDLLRAQLSFAKSGPG